MYCNAVIAFRAIICYDDALRSMPWAGECEVHISVDFQTSPIF